MNPIPSSVVIDPIRPVRSGSYGLMKFIFGLLNLGLVVYFVWKMGISGVSADKALGEFVLIRNGLYLTYAIFFIMAGLAAGLKNAGRSDATSDRLIEMLPLLVVNLIYTTFSFSVAKLIAVELLPIIYNR